MFPLFLKKKLPLSLDLLLSGGLGLPVLLPARMNFPRNAKLVKVYGVTISISVVVNRVFTPRAGA